MHGGCLRAGLAHIIFSIHFIFLHYLWVIRWIRAGISTSCINTHFLFTASPDSLIIENTFECPLINTHHSLVCVCLKPKLGIIQHINTQFRIHRAKSNVKQLQRGSSNLFINWSKQKWTWLLPKGALSLHVFHHVNSKHEHIKKLLPSGGWPLQRVCFWKTCKLTKQWWKLAHIDNRDLSSGSGLNTCQRDAAERVWCWKVAIKQNKRIMLFITFTRHMAALIKCAGSCKHQAVSDSIPHIRLIKKKKCAWNHSYCLNILD